MNSSFDLSLHYRLDYAVSFYGNEDGITEKEVRLDDLTTYIEQVVYLTDHQKVGEHRAPEDEGTAGHAAITDLAFGQPSAQA